MLQPRNYGQKGQEYEWWEWTNPTGDHRDFVRATSFTLRVILSLKQASQCSLRKTVRSKEESPLDHSPPQVFLIITPSKKSLGSKLILFIQTLNSTLNKPYTCVHTHIPNTQTHINTHSVFSSFGLEFGVTKASFLALSFLHTRDDVRLSFNDKYLLERWAHENFTSRKQNHRGL